MATKSLGRVSIVPQGDYDENRVYKRLDLVKDDGKTYLSLKEDNIDPLSDADSWMLLTESGRFEDLTPQELDTILQPLNEATEAANEAANTANEAAQNAVTGSTSLGTITPSSTIPTEGNVWGFAGEGTYPNAGNLTVSPDTLGILTRVDDVWSKVEVAFNYEPNGKVEEGDNSAVSGENVYNAIKDAYSIFNREKINLINPDEIEIGYLNNGVFSANVNYKTTGFIECKNGDVVRCTNGLNWAIYDQNNQVLVHSTVFSFDNFTVNHADAKYLRIDNHAGVTDWMLVINRQLPTTYVPYGEYDLSFNNDSESGKVIDEQIEIKNKVKEIHVNIFDKTKVLIGYLNNGIFSANPNYFTSDFMEVNMGETIHTFYFNVAFYDNEFNLLSYNNNGNGAPIEITDSSVKYIRIDAPIAELDALMVTKGFKDQPFFIPYENTKYSFESSNPWKYSWLTSKNRGKRWLTLGDSICNGVPYGYRQQTTIQLDLININHAEDGATIGDTSGSSRIISNYIDTITDDADIITVHAMVNDANAGLPIGTFSDTANTTFYGAYRMVAEKLLNKFTGKKIAFMTAIQRANNTALKPYVEVIKEIGAYYGIPVLDLNATCGLYPDLPAYHQYYDGILLHPNLEGHKIITPKVVDFINGL